MRWRDCREQLRIYMPFACGICYFRVFAHSSYILFSFFPMFHFVFAVLCCAVLCFIAIWVAHGFRPSQIQRTHSQKYMYTHTYIRHLPWNGCRITVRITIKFAFITFKCSNKLFGRALVCLVFVSIPFKLRSMVLCRSLFLSVASPSYSPPLFCSFLFLSLFVYLISLFFGDHEIDCHSYMLGFSVRRLWLRFSFTFLRFFTCLVFFHQSYNTLFNPLCMECSLFLISILSVKCLFHITHSVVDVY